MKKKSNLILEFTEFQAQRMNTGPSIFSVHPNNPELSSDSYDRQQWYNQSMLARLFRLNSFLQMGGRTRGHIIEISNLKLLQMNEVNNSDLEAHIEFELDENVYWGVVRSLLRNPVLHTEAWREIQTTKEAQVRVESHIVKSLLDWLTPYTGKYKCIHKTVGRNVETGKEVIIPENWKIDVEYVELGMLEATLLKTGEYFRIESMPFYKFNALFEYLDDLK